MNKGYISHRAAFNECYALDRDTLFITIRTGYEVTGVELCYGDPFSSGILGGAEEWNGTKISMERGKELSAQQLWTVEVKPEFKRCKYYFIIHAGKEEAVYFEDGCHTGEQLAASGRKPQYFFFPWMNESDLAVTPDWAADTVWYQIFPDRFCNGDEERNPPHTKPWRCEKTHYQDVYGGDLAGIRRKLPYLKELGITGIYLNPIFASDSNHKYNTNDYYKIDEAFGSEEEFCLLVREAHEAGIRVMLDAVFNHCGTKFAPWQEVLEKGPDSEYYSWFFINEWPFDRESHDTRDGKFYSFAFSSGMPKLNTNLEEVSEYFTKLCSYWLTEWGIDGIRFDVGNEVSHSFLKTLRRNLKKINPEVYLLGEIWHDAIPWLLGDEYDSVMNYPFTQSIHDFFVDKSRTAEDFKHAVNRCYSLYYRQVNRVIFNLLDSHDTERLYERTGSLAVFYQQLAILFTMEGSPCIYYGTEIAMPGAHDPDCRRCMPWEEIEAGVYKDRIGAMKKLIELRRNHPACRSGKTVWKQAPENERILWYEQTKAGERTIGVILNVSGEEYSFRVHGTVLFSYGYGNGILDAEGTLIYEGSSDSGAGFLQ